jgi:hypothetical protein
MPVGYDSLSAMRSFEEDNSVFETAFTADITYWRYKYYKPHKEEL